MEIKCKDNTKRNKRFERICRVSQKELKAKLKRELENAYGINKIECGDGWLYAKGNIPIVVTAHLDTVHKELPSTIVYENGTISSPQGIGGDDRCGVYMIMEIIREMKPHILFFEDEEIGGVGSDKFIDTHICEDLRGKINFCIDLDRKGSQDAVYYELDNIEFEDFVAERYWKTAYGSFTDICNICPALECAGVNLSCGYYKQHTTDEYVVLTEMYKAIEETKRLIKRGKEMKFEWREYAKWKWGDYHNYKNWNFPKYNARTVYEEDYCITFISENGEDVYFITACSEEEAVGCFLIDNPTKRYEDIIDISFIDNY